MKLTWLGQAGYYIETDDGTTIMIDPYLSNNLETQRGEAFKREVAVSEYYQNIVPDVLIFSHCHEDHLDLETIGSMLTKGKSVYVLSSRSSWKMLREKYSPKHEYVLFDCGVEITIHEVRFRSVFAFHSDEYAIGIIIEADGKVLYHTGDTLYHNRLLDISNEQIDAMMVPINGKGNNLNAADAARLVKAISPKNVFPMHWDMFKSYGCDPSEFNKLFREEENTHIIIPKHYNPVET